MSHIKSFNILLAALLLTGCSDAPVPPTGTAKGQCETGAVEPVQTLIVDSAPRGASCTLKNSKGEWLVATTPGTAGVARSGEPLDVVCIKTGYADGKKTVDSAAQDNSVALLLGRDLMSLYGPEAKMAYDYPGSIMVKLNAK